MRLHRFSGWKNEAVLQVKDGCVRERVIDDGQNGRERQELEKEWLELHHEPEHPKLARALQPGRADLFEDRHLTAIHRVASLRQKAVVQHTFDNGAPHAADALNAE